MRKTAAFQPDSDPPPPPPPSGSGSSRKSARPLLRISDQYDIDADEVVCVERSNDYIVVHLRSGVTCHIEANHGEHPWDAKRRIVRLINDVRRSK